MKKGVIFRDFELLCVTYNYATKHHESLALPGVYVFSSFFKKEIKSAGDRT